MEIGRTVVEINEQAGSDQIWHHIPTTVTALDCRSVWMLPFKHSLQDQLTLTAV